MAAAVLVPTRTNPVRTARPRRNTTSTAPPAREQTHPYVRKRSKTISVSPSPSSGRNSSPSPSLQQSHPISVACTLPTLPPLPHTPPPTSHRRLLAAPRTPSPSPTLYSPSRSPFRESFMRTELPGTDEVDDICWTPSEDEDARHSLLGTCDLDFGVAVAMSSPERRRKELYVD
ncbi:hypothetical protein CYLTODRAFT_258822 [Cylindrobasidium torrendii FP15055 ss-10]|uniref:Uncharacterized protein n=1 Tax=Cylindrobasidium torrendii FP15055 ss-10 TaxID=1314674 RepID=A0A0D7BEE7_9AGAR|nr:hypothetical protein CYLTODRAFT_258822 [Cylindrobasidium torrendii FP15055 ss-10]